MPMSFAYLWYLINRNHIWTHRFTITAFGMQYAAYCTIFLMYNFSELCFLCIELSYLFLIEFCLGLPPTASVVLSAEDPVNSLS